MEQPEERLAVKALQIMDHVHLTLNSIRECRRAGEYRGHLVDHLNQLLIGIRDDTFWDGLPEEAREKVHALEAAGDKKAMHQARKIRELYWPMGWQGVSVRAIPNADGSARFLPTSQDIDQMEEILMQLLHRKGLLWKTRLHSPLPPVPEK